MTQKDFAETTPYTRKLMARYLGESCVHSSIRCAKAYLNDIVRIECVFLSYENAYFQMLIHTVGKNWRKEVKEAV